MTNIALGGFVRDNAGGALTDPTVELFDRNDTATVLDTASLSSTGYWSFDRSPDNDNTDRYDVRVTNGSEQRFLSYDDQVQLTSLETAYFRFRNPTGAQANKYVYDIVGSVITADRTLTLPLITGTDTFAVLGLAQTFSAAQTFTSTVTVGVSDTGHDVQFFGATANTYMLWDESTDDLVLALGAELYLYDAGGGEHIKSNGTDMTIYAGTDLNLTAGTDINIPTGVGLTFGDDGEKIEGDGTNLVVESSGTLDMNSGGVLTLDSGAAINLEPAAGSAILLDGTISVDAGVVTGATSITSTAFVGALTGNASGTAATVTGGTQASITTVANVVEVGALNAGSITSGFGTIDTGSSNITTTGTVSAEQLTTTDDLALSSSGAVINFNSGNITLTHADDELVLKSGDGNTLLGIDAVSGGESILRFRNQGNNYYQFVNVPGTRLALYSYDIDGSGTDGDLIQWAEGTAITAFQGGVTVGADTDGHDVQFFGDTTNAYFLWDESANALALSRTAGTLAVPVNSRLHLEGASTDIQFSQGDIVGDAGTLRQVIHKKDVATGSAQSVCYIRTINETGDADAGAYSCRLTAVIKTPGDSDGSNDHDPGGSKDSTGVMGHTVFFAVQQDLDRGATASAVMEESQTAYAGSARHTIDGIVVTIEPGNGQTLIKYNVAYSGSDGDDSYDIQLLLEVCYTTHQTPPIIDPM